MTLEKSFKKFSFVVASRIVNSGSHALFYIIFVFFMTPEEYGNLSYIIALAGTFSIISRFGLPYSSAIFQSKNEEEKANQINFLAIITTSIAAIILIPINLFAAILSLGTSLFLMNFFNLLGQRKYKEQFKLVCIQGILMIIIPLVLYIPLGISGVMLGLIASNVLPSISYLRLIKISKNFSKIKNTSKVLFNNFGVDASTNLPKMIDKLLIVPILGFSTVGIYQFNLQVLLALEVIPTALHSFLLPEESQGKNRNKIALGVFGLISSVTIFIIILVPHAIPIILPEYSKGIQSMQIMILAIIPITMSHIINAKLQARESTTVGYSAIVRIGSLLLFIGIFAPLFEQIGLAISVVLSSIAYTIYLLIVYYKSKYEKRDLRYG
ncbi:oligosaccharide flippase family protein [Nitrosopumilus sp. K4]|uniref:lipopolysaccharide biosynthesis protein n=1 Tax=Nitrosopumilus sp. K4 TaxID=2795383 RepID=UPI001BAA523B|nr:oligosaccharide flippase family protein [Nitrosopumilus sp. K4]QUC64515.1 oligosaccharide flippase family protein [Nitrosopumilus sp. K4]